MAHFYAFLFFFFNDTATTEIYTLSLHDALPIFNTSDRETRHTTYIYSTRQLICRGAFQIHAARPIYTSIARPHVMHPSPQPPHKERVPRLNRQVVCRPLTRFQAQSAHAQVGLRGEGYQFIPHR